MSSSEEDLERERIACVYGLGGGELHKADERLPDEWDGPGGIAYWYEGLPEYVTPGEIGLDLDSCGEVRTAILSGIYGLPAPPEGWVQVASFWSSGEAPCWWCGDHDQHGDHQDADGDDDACKLCEGGGYVYLGDGWAGVLYCRVRAM